MVNQSFELGYISNSSLKASFSFQDFNVTDVYVPAGEKNSLSAEIEVPENAELGTYELDLTAEAGTKLSKSFQIEIRGLELEKDISMELEQPDHWKIASPCFRLTAYRRFQVKGDRIAQLTHNKGLSWKGQ